jgi:hypothetical protein
MAATIQEGEVYEPGDVWRSTSRFFEDTAFLTAAFALYGGRDEADRVVVACYANKAWAKPGGYAEEVL